MLVTTGTAAAPLLPPAAAQALGVAATTMTGQRLGAGEPIKARDSAKMIHRVGLCFSAVLMAFFFCFARQVAGFYTPDTETATHAASALRMVAIGLPFIFTQIPLAAALRGAGDTKGPFIISVLGMWGVRMAIAYVLAYVFDLGLAGAWFGMAADLTVRGLISLVRMQRKKWLHIWN